MRIEATVTRCSFSSGGSSTPVASATAARSSAIFQGAALAAALVSESSAAGCRYGTSDTSGVLADDLVRHSRRPSRCRSLSPCTRASARCRPRSCSRRASCVPAARSARAACRRHGRRARAASPGRARPPPRAALDRPPEAPERVVLISSRPRSGRARPSSRRTSSASLPHAVPAASTGCTGTPARSANKREEGLVLDLGLTADRRGGRAVPVEQCATMRRR